MSTKNNGFGSMSEGCKPSNKREKARSKKRPTLPLAEHAPAAVNRFHELSYFFSENTLYRMYITHPALQRFMHSGKYVFVDERMVLDSPKYISKKGKKIHLTSFANNNPEECCVARKANYTTRKRNPPPQPRTLTGVRYQRRHVPSKTFKGYSFIPAGNDASFSVNHNSFMDFASGGQEPPHDSYGKALTFLMGRENVTEECLSEETGIAVRTIGRMRNNMNKPSLEYVIAICIALTLTFTESELLAALAGYDISGTSLRVTKEIRAYQYLIEVMRYKWTVSECNSFLKAHGLSPLTNI